MCETDSLPRLLFAQVGLFGGKGMAPGELSLERRAVADDDMTLEIIQSDSVDYT